MDKTIALALGAIPPHLRPHADRICAAARRTLEGAWEIGQELVAVRAAAKYGEWLPFLRVLGIPERSARRYMRVAVELAERPDAERDPLTTIRAVLEGPADEAAPVDWRFLDAGVARHLGGDDERAALGDDDDEHWEIGGQKYRTHPVLAIIPRMDDTVLESLVDSILEIGQIDPVVVHAGTRTLVDGRGRMRACALAGVAVKWIELPFETSPSAAVWGYNVLRQRMTAEERALVAAECEAVRSMAGASAVGAGDSGSN